MIGNNGLSEEEFRAGEGVSGEEHIARSLRVQARIAQGSGFVPRVLPEARAVALNDQYGGQEERLEE